MATKPSRTPWKYRPLGATEASAYRTTIWQTPEQR
uniref:Uncharacterized protein n=1 Tax=Arundo donax TaxID=35708 RepID=A0A0A8Y6H0_ARUDO